MIHLRAVFPAMSAYIQDHGTLAWYQNTYSLNSLGEKTAGKHTDTHEDNDDDNEVQVHTEASSYTCLKPLLNLAEKMMRGSYEIALCKLTADCIAGKSLNLANQEDTLKTIMQDISAKYAVDFPPKKDNILDARVTHDGMEVIKTATLQDKAEYEIAMDKYLKASAENETLQIKEYIMSRIAFVIDDLTDELPNKISKQGLAKESKRKMCVYSSELFGMRSVKIFMFPMI